MKSIDDLDKIKSVILYILQQCGGTQDFVSLVKKMYFAQRKHLALYGRPIFNDMFYARERGPVPSFTYKALFACYNKSGVSEEINHFNASFGVNVVNGERIVSAKESPDMDELAGAEIKTINTVIDETKGFTAEYLSELSHKDQAWKLARKRVSDDPTDGRMSLVSIARAGGANKGIIDYLRESLTFDYWCKA